MVFEYAKGGPVKLSCRFGGFTLMSKVDFLIYLLHYILSDSMRQLLFTFILFFTLWRVMLLSVNNENKGNTMDENQLDELMELHANAIIDHIKGLVKDRKKITKTMIYAMLDELKKYKRDVDDSSYIYEKTQAIDAIDNNAALLDNLAGLKPTAIELVNYGNDAQKARFVELVANMSDLDELPYTSCQAPNIIDGNIVFDV